MQKPPCWVVPCHKIPHYGKASYLTGNYATDILSALHSHGRWEPRTAELEENTDLRQVIPYVLMTNVLTDKIMVMERTKEQDEARLHGNLCLGAGGHVEPVDAYSDDLIQKAAAREIEEETGFKFGEYVLRFAGIICITDPKSEIVHRVHIGVVYHGATNRETFGGELTKQNAKWMSALELVDAVNRMEVWSKEVMFGRLCRENNVNLSPASP